MMELEQGIYVGVVFAASVLGVWFVWKFFCKKTNGLEADNKSTDDDSDAFSSTQVITGSNKIRRKKRQRSNPDSCNDTTTDDDAEYSDVENNVKTKKNYRRKSQPKSKEKSKDAYRYQENSYGLHDPFGEWAPKKPTTFKENLLINGPVVHNYPKSPAIGRKISGSGKGDVVLDL